MTNLNPKDVRGVATAVLRGVAFTEVAGELVDLLRNAQAKFDTLESLIDTANQSHESTPLTVTPEDQKVVDGAKEYANAEEDVLKLLLEYLEYAVQYSYADLSDDAPVTDGFSGLMPNV